MARRGRGRARGARLLLPRAIELADEHGDQRVAFPAISAGVYGYPLDQAATVAIGAVRDALEAHPGVEEARFWLFDRRAYDAFEAALRSEGV